MSEIDPVTGERRIGVPSAVIDLSVTKSVRLSRPAEKSIALIVQNHSGLNDDSFVSLRPGDEVLLFLIALPPADPQQPRIAELTAKFGPLYILPGAQDVGVFDVRGSDVVARSPLTGLQSSSARPDQDGVAPEAAMTKFSYSDIEAIVRSEAGQRVKGTVCC